MDDSIQNVEYPTVEAEPPREGDLLVELLVFNRDPLKNHWAYWICERPGNQIGVKVHIVGDPQYGYYYQASRTHCLFLPGNIPFARIPLQWVSSRYFQWQDMLNWGQPREDFEPIGPFETWARMVDPPGRSLWEERDNTVFWHNTDYRASIQRREDSQIWVCEAADSLARASVFMDDTARFLWDIVE